MPATIRTGTLRYKKSDGTYDNFNAVAEQSIAQEISLVEDTGQAQITAIQNKGTETIASIPSDYIELSEEVSNSSVKLVELDQIAENTASEVGGTIITITNGGKDTPINKTVVNIGFAQSGSGDPTPENVRPFIEKKVVNVTVSPSDSGDDGKVYSFVLPTFETGIGGGTLTVDANGNATLTLTHGIISFDGSEKWKMLDSGGHRFYVENVYPYKAPTLENVTDVRENYYCSMAKAANMWYSGNSGVFGKFVIGNTMIKVLDSQEVYPDLAAFKQWLADMAEAGTPLQFLYPLENPVTFPFTGTPILTEYGTNNIWSDGDSMSIEYHPSSVLSHDRFRVPAYYLANGYLRNKLLAIEGAMEAADGNSDTFAFLTDAHWTGNAKHSPLLINYLNRHIPIPRLFIGGDMGEGIDLNFTDAFKQAYTGKMYMAMGNHEYHNYFYEIGGTAEAKTITNTMLWNYFNSGMYDAVVGNASRNYYYVDNPVQKMRYIVLSVYTVGSEALFEQDQQTWLADTALNLPSGYTAIIFAHQIASTDKTTGVCEPSGVGTTIASIADNYTGNGKIAALIAGHRHFDGVGKTTGGIPIFVTTCDKYTYSDEYDGWLSTRRKRCTITEQAFDIFVVDKKNQKVTAIRIGCPADNPAGEPLETREAYYGTL